MRELPRHRRRSTAMNFHTLIRPLFATATVSAFAVMLCLPLSAQTIDPDPELFDGTRTKKDQIQQDEKKKADKWEDANLILYDSNEQGSEQGGQGRVGGEGPGYAEGVQGGAGMQGGIPMPMMGGGGQSDKQTIPGMTPTSQQSAQTQQGQGGPQSNSPGPGKPGEVSIGDPSQQIAASARPVSKVGGVPPPPTGEEVKESKGEDTTTIPSSASGQQSGQRGGGVEKGDAMPTDI